jgi:hypothetical protein
MDVIDGKEVHLHHQLIGSGAGGEAHIFNVPCEGRSPHSKVQIRLVDTRQDAVDPVKQVWEMSDIPLGINIGEKRTFIVSYSGNTNSQLPSLPCIKSAPYQLGSP